MAGLGRRTHYRKHLTDSIIYDFPEPNANELIAKVVATRGGNQFDIILPRANKGKESSNVADTEEDDKTFEYKPQLAILPTKFNKLVWVKRNDFVIVETVIDQEEENEEEKSAIAANNKKEHIHDGIRFMISHILYKDQVKHLQSKGLWPTHDNEFSAGGVRSIEEAEGGTPGEGVDDMVEADDGIVYDMGFEEDDEYFVNTNRLANLKVDDSSDSESSDEE